MQSFTATARCRLSVRLLELTNAKRKKNPSIDSSERKRRSGSCSVLEAVVAVTTQHRSVSAYEKHAVSKQRRETAAAAVVVVVVAAAVAVETSLQAVCQSGLCSADQQKINQQIFIDRLFCCFQSESVCHETFEDIRTLRD